MKPVPTRRNIWDALEVGPLRMSEISSRSGVPLRFCQQMVWQMKREGFLKQRIKCHYERAQ